jgi:hypothetical protein
MLFDTALAAMTQQARLQLRADDLTAAHTAFRSFSDLLDALGDYRPSLSRSEPELRELGLLYDAAQQARGDSRRAFMYGNPRRSGSLIDFGNFDKVEQWYRRGDRVASWDRHTHQWIVYSLDSKGYQRGSASFYRNQAELLRSEECHD